jgi:hypothetical protein
MSFHCASRFATSHGFPSSSYSNILDVLVVVIFSLCLYYVVSFNNGVLGVIVIVLFLFSLNDLHFSHDEASKHFHVNFLS